jgi:uncharacterized cupin superfamily protein
MPNIYEPHFDQDRKAPEGFCDKRAFLGKQAGGERLGMSLWELMPGEAAYPYHFHLTDEELLVVLEGMPHLRTTEGWRQLERGEVVSFHRGQRGAHQLVNWTEKPVRFLAFSEITSSYTVVYPDSRKLATGERYEHGFHIDIVYPQETEVDYWHGEQPPERP